MRALREEKIPDGGFDAPVRVNQTHYTANDTSENTRRTWETSFQPTCHPREAANCHRFRKLPAFSLGEYNPAGRGGATEKNYIMKDCESSPIERNSRPNGPFCWSSKSALNQIRHYMEESDKWPSLPTRLNLYFALIELASNHGKSTFYASRKRLSDLCGISPRTVQEATKDLEAAQVIEVEDPEGGMQVAKVYRLIEIPRAATIATRAATIAPRTETVAGRAAKRLAGGPLPPNKEKKKNTQSLLRNLPQKILCVKRTEKNPHTLKALRASSGPWAKPFA